MAKKYTQAEWARIQAKLPEEDRVPYSDSPEAPPRGATKTDAQKDAELGISRTDSTIPSDEQTRLRITGLPTTLAGSLAALQKSIAESKSAVATAEANISAGKKDYTIASTEAANAANFEAELLLNQAQNAVANAKTAEEKAAAEAAIAAAKAAADAAATQAEAAAAEELTAAEAAKAAAKTAAEKAAAEAAIAAAKAKADAEAKAKADAAAKAAADAAAKAAADAAAKAAAGGAAAAASATATKPTLAKDIFKQTLAMFFGQVDASKPWMDELYNVVSKFYLSGADVSEALNMALLDSRNNPALKEFTDRFKGIYGLMDMKQAGKPVTIPTIAEYVSSQAKMADILTQANLAGLATTEYTGELIGKGNSVSTIADKIANVFNRIDFAPKEIKDTLSRYFPTADRLKLAGALLQGEKGVTQLADELAQYEVLAAAEAQGVGALGARAKAGGVTEERAQQYARMGGTFQSLLPKFGQIARALPTTSKLAGISRVEDIGQVGLEKAVITQSAKELQQLEQLSTEEEARFAAKAGRMEQGLASQRRANRAF